jgi:hypothetical protein
MLLSSASRARPATSRLALGAPVFIAFLVLATLTRLGLLVFNGDVSLFAPLHLVPALLLGLGYDAAVALWWGLPLVLLGAAWPRSRGRGGLQVAALLLTGLLLGAAIFIGVAEFVFWNEFASRFNFIAVDYLIYTREVVGNIRESYALGPMFAGIGVATLLTVLAVAGPSRWPRPVRSRARCQRRPTSASRCWPPHRSARPGRTASSSRSSCSWPATACGSSSTRCATTRSTSSASMRRCRRRRWRPPCSGTSPPRRATT